MTPIDIVSDELKARDRDRWLACLYAPPAARTGLISLFALDCELAQLVATTSDAMIGQIRLAWWRERLTELDGGKVPAQPLLQALATSALPRVSGAALAGLEDRWIDLIEAAAVPDSHVEGGGLLFRLAARLLNGNEAEAQALGRAWALGEPVAGGTSAPLRPLRGLAALAARDAARARAGQPREARGAPVRQLRLLWTVVSGR